MTKRWTFICAACLLALCCLPVWGQIGQIPQFPGVIPIPVPGGDVSPPLGLVNLFTPGIGDGFDGLNAEPNGITNFKGVVAMGYAVGTTKASDGTTYQVIVDDRVY